MESPTNKRKRSDGQAEDNDGATRPAPYKPEESTVTDMKATSTSDETSMRPAAREDTTNADDTSESAVPRVLGVTELLENILTHVPMFKLFVLQRTCKAFRNTMRHSIELRQIMFLSADPPSTGNAGDRTWNPILHTAVFQTSRAASEVYFLPRGNQGRVQPEIWFGLTRWPGKRKHLPHRRDIAESWRSMVPAQPAIHPLFIRWAYQRQGVVTWDQIVRRWYTPVHSLLSAAVHLEDPADLAWTPRLGDIYQALHDRALAGSGRDMGTDIESRTTGLNRPPWPGHYRDERE